MTLLAILPGVTTSASAQTPQPDEHHVYKTVDDVSLELHVFRPEMRDADSAAPAIVFFFGGGWRNGSPQQFYPHCEHLAELGMVAMSESSCGSVRCVVEVAGPRLSSHRSDRDET